MNVYAFTGKAQSGKSTACHHVFATAPVPELVTQINFKSALIKEMKQNFPDVLQQLRMQQIAKTGRPQYSVNDLFSEKPPVMRELMQNYGTEVRRGDNPNYWVNRWKESVKSAEEQGISTLLVDDCRFLNEAEAVKEVGGTIIRIERTDIIDTGTHQSEVEMGKIDVDHIISVNKGEHEELFAALDDIIK